jgi:hypothetical protein
MFKPRTPLELALHARQKQKGTDRVRLNIEISTNLSSLLEEACLGTNNEPKKGLKTLIIEEALRVYLDSVKGQNLNSLLGAASNG